MAASCQQEKEYSCKDTGRAIRQVKSSVNWLRLDRFHKNIPEHALVTWLVIQNKPTARDMLAQWGLLKISDLRNVILKIERKERKSRHKFTWFNNVPASMGVSS